MIGRQVGNADAERSSERNCIRQPRVDLASLDVDQPPLGAADEVGELLLREAAACPVAANVIADRKCHAGGAPHSMVRRIRGQNADNAP